MSDSNVFDLSDFQSKVFKHFNTLLTMEDVKNKDITERLDINTENFCSSFLSNYFYKAIESLEKYAVKEFFNKRDILEYQSKSRALLFNENIKQILCPGLIGIDEISLAEEKILQAIKILTSELLKQPIREKFAIDKDAHLFAFMTLALFEKGIKSYCSSN